MLVRNVGQVGRELWGVDKLEGDNLSESRKNPSNGAFWGITLNLLRKSSNIKVVLGSLHRISLPCLKCLNLHRKRLFDCLVGTWPDLELHVTNCNSIKRACIFGMRMGPECDFSSRSHLRITCVLLKHLLRDNYAAQNWCVDEDRSELLLCVVLREVDCCHRLKAFWFDQYSSVPKTTHLKQLAEIRRS